MQGNRNYLLDGMRGVAAILVVAYHASKSFDLRWVVHGYLAVDFFFLLSGYVIARAYDDRLRDGMMAEQFLALRVIRLYPLFLLGIGRGLGWHLLLAARSGASGDILQALNDATFNAAMLPSLLNKSHALFPLNNAAWSLFFEFVINVAYALILYRLPNPALLVIAGLGAVGMVIGVLNAGNLDLGWEWSSAWGGMCRVSFSFPLGMVIARSRGNAVRRSSAIGYILVGLLVLAMATRGPASAAPVIDIALALVAFPAILWIAVATEVPTAAKAAFGWLGDLSYPLYMVHLPLIGVGKAVRSVLHIGVVPFMLLEVSALAILAAALARIYDVPLRSWMMQSTRRASGATTD